jgi:DNA-binding transcriptional LysR family regulator
LRFFIAVAEELHARGREASRPHPHLSREIRRLEDELDVPLFARDRRRVTLAAAGCAFFEHGCRPEGHPLAHRPEIALAALAHEPWIFFPRAVASRLHDEIIHACHEAGFTPRIVQEALKLSKVSSFVASGLRVSARSGGRSPRRRPRCRSP